MSNKYNIIYNKNKYVSGAGILILEKIDNKWTLILFKDHTNKFADVGGIYEKNHFNISDTASQELKEESRNLFILSDLKKLRKYIDIKHKKNNSYYKSFLITLSDINPDMLKIGRDKIFDKGLINKAKTVVANAEELPFADNSFDLVTMAFGLRNVTDKKQALREMYRIVKPGGNVLVMEFSAPENKLVQSLYDKYSFNLIPKLGEFFANDAASYKYLVESIRRHPNQDTLRDWFFEAKFDECKVDNILSGIVAIHQGYKF